MTAGRARAGNGPGRAARLDVRIDELVVEGVAASDPDLVGGALSRELERLAAEGGMPAGLGGVPGAAPVLDAGSLDTPPGAPPEAVGAAAARAIWRGLGGTGRRP